MLSPLRLLALGLASDDVCALYGLTPEELDLRCEQAEARRCEIPAPSAGNSLMTGKSLMTRLLRRPGMDKWESRTAERL